MPHGGQIQNASNVANGGKSRRYVGMGLLAEMEMGQKWVSSYF